MQSESGLNIDIQLLADRSNGSKELLSGKMWLLKMTW
jgi:hypothetical protein